MEINVLKLQNITPI